MDICAIPRDTEEEKKRNAGVVEMLLVGGHGIRPVTGMERVATKIQQPEWNSDVQRRSGGRGAKKSALCRCIASGFHVRVVVSAMVSLVVVVVLASGCMSLALRHLHLPAKLFSSFERCVMLLLLLLLLLAMVGMKIIMIWNMSGCTVAVAHRKQDRRNGSSP